MQGTGEKSPPVHNEEIRGASTGKQCTTYQGIVTVSELI